MTKHELRHAHDATNADGSFDIAQAKEQAAKAFENIENGHSKPVFFTESTTPDGITVYTLAIRHS